MPRSTTTSSPRSGRWSSTRSSQGLDPGAGWSRAPIRTLNRRRSTSSCRVRSTTCSGSSSPQGWTDGHPVRPTDPGPRSTAFLADSGHDPWKTLGVAASSGRDVTVWSIAVNAVMAGCRPEHLPVLMALAEVLLDPAYGAEHSGNTTGADALVVISGPEHRAPSGSTTASARCERGITPTPPWDGGCGSTSATSSASPPTSTTRPRSATRPAVVLAEDLACLDADRLGATERRRRHRRGPRRGDGRPDEQWDHHRQRLRQQRRRRSSPTSAMVWRGPRRGTSPTSMASGTTSSHPCSSCLLYSLASSVAPAGRSADVQRALFEHARIPAATFERMIGEWSNLTAGRPRLVDLVADGVLPAVYGESDDPERLVPVATRPGTIPRRGGRRSEPDQRLRLQQRRSPRLVDHQGRGPHAGQRPGVFARREPADSSGDPLRRQRARLDLCPARHRVASGRAGTDHVSPGRPHRRPVLPRPLSRRRSPPSIDRHGIRAVFISGHGAPPEAYDERQRDGLAGDRPQPARSRCSDSAAVCSSSPRPSAPTIVRMGRLPEGADDPTSGLSSPDGSPNSGTSRCGSPATHPLLEGLGDAPVFRHAHSYQLADLPDGFVRLAETELVPDPARGSHASGPWPAPSSIRSTGPTNTRPGERLILNFCRVGGCAVVTGTPLDTLSPGGSGTPAHRAACRRPPRGAMAPSSFPP